MFSEILILYSFLNSKVPTLYSSFMFCFGISQFLIYCSQSSMETDNLFFYFWVFSFICLRCSSILDELVFELVPTNILMKFSISTISTVIGIPTVSVGQPSVSVGKP